MKKVHFVKTIVLINIIIPFVFFLYDQIISRVYNTGIKMSLQGRFLLSTQKNEFLWIYLVIAVPAAVFIGLYLFKIKEAVNDSSLVQVAQTRITRLPAIIIFIYILGFLSGPVVAFAAASAIKLNELAYILAVSFFGGLLAVSFSLILMDLALFHAKQALSMHILGGKGKELSLVVKFLLAVVSMAGLSCSVSLVIGNYYLVKGPAADTGPYLYNMVLHNGIILFFGVILIILLTVNLLMMISHMRKSVKSIIEGKGDLSRRINIASFDEVGMLASDFNALFIFLDGMIGRIKRISVDMNESQRLLLESVGSTRQIFESFVDSIGQVIEGIEQEFQQSEKLNTAAMNTFESSEMIKNSVLKQQGAIELSVDSTQKVAGIIKKVTDVAEDLKKNIGGLSKQVHQGKASLQGSIESIRIMSNSSRSLLELNHLISDISDRIKILSLNASIEAVNAGRAGEGFVVVAREVKKLSDESARNVKNIEKTMIKMNQNVIDSSSQISKTGEIIEGAFQKIEYFIQSLEIIITSMEEEKNTTKTIIEAAEEMKKQGMDLSVTALSGRDESGRMKKITQDFISITQKIYHLTAAQKDKNKNLSEINVKLKSVADSLQKYFEELHDLLENFVLTEKE